MEGLEFMSFKIISSVGEAKSDFISAIRFARKGDMESARIKMKDGDVNMIAGHKVHAKLLQEESMGKNLQINLLLVHAEDQLMNAETCKVNAEEFLIVYEKMHQLEKQDRLRGRE